MADTMRESDYFLSVSTGKMDTAGADGSFTMQMMRDLTYSLIVPHASLRITATPNATATTVGASNTWYRLVQEMTADDKTHFGFAHDSNAGRLIYEGTGTRDVEFSVNVSFSVATGGGNTANTIQFALAKNQTSGFTPLAGSIVESRVSGNTDIRAIGLRCHIKNVATNDYFYVIVKNVTDAKDVLPIYLTWHAQGHFQ